MIHAKEVVAVFGICFILVGSWMITPGLGMIVVGICILSGCTFLGAEGNEEK